MFSFFFHGIIISSIGLFNTILLPYDLATASALLFPKNLPVLRTTFLEAVFKESSSVFSNWLLYFLDKFLANDKNLYLLLYFLFLVL